MIWRERGNIFRLLSPQQQKELPSASVRPPVRRSSLYDRLYYHLAARGIMKRENGSDSKVKKAGTSHRASLSKTVKCT